MTSVSTTFDPKVHGFRFINCFEFPDLFKINPSFPPFKFISEIVYGLCGGMCYTALDYYRAARLVPTESDVDNISLRLFRYLWTRQMDTLSLPVLEKLVAWVVLSTRPLHKKTGLEEAPAVMHSIDLGSPCVLVLIRSKGLLKMDQNHQVLAIGYHFNPITKELTIQLYDPNYPGKTPEISMSLLKPSSGIKLAQSTGDPIRGFFKIDYVPSSPPL